MGIRIPKYSEQGGEVSLPTRRMTPLSPREVYAAGAPGRALAAGGAALTRAGEQVFEVEKQDQEKKNKMWLVSASTDLEMEMTQKSEELKLNQVPGDYISNESFVNGTNKDTYTNQTMSSFDGLIDKETDNKAKEHTVLATTVYDKLQEINGNVLTIKAKLNGKVIQ